MLWCLVTDCIWRVREGLWRWSLELQKESKVSYITCSVLEILLCCLALPSVYIVYFQEMSPELFSSWQNTAPCECWGTDLGTFYTTTKSICYPKQYCWLSLHDLRAASYLKFQMEGATAGSILSVVFSNSSGEAEPCNVPQEWAMVGAMLWAWAGARGREICRLSCDLIWIFTPQKSVPEKNYIFFFCSVIK